MNKLMTVSIAAVMAAGFANAQNDMVMVDQAPEKDPAATEVTIEAALVSSHVWRGQVYNNDFVFQPQMTAAQYGVSLNVWANYDIGKNYQGVQGETSEIDFSLAYSLPLDINDIAFDLGMIRYHYPANGDAVNESTTELFAKATILSIKEYLVPSITFFGDIDEVDGTYILFDFASQYEVSEYLTVNGGFSTGWGNTRYNSVYWTQSADEGFNDFNFYGSATYEVMENLYASLSLQYTMLAGGQIEDAARDRYEAKEKVFGGVNIAYDF